MNENVVIEENFLIQPGLHTNHQSLINLGSKVWGTSNISGDSYRKIQKFYLIFTCKKLSEFERLSNEIALILL